MSIAKHFQKPIGLAISGLASALLYAAGAAVLVSGGHDTDPRDHGRPDVLIAAGLGVPTDVFREAFSHVKPAPSGERPDPAQVERNKQALLSALGKYGVTNDSLDRVSNYYRYNRSRGEMWPVHPAVISVAVANGVITGFKIVDAGSGYSSPPTITVADHPELKVTVQLAFGKDLGKNGSIASITILPLI